mmetsp:Transcript_33302/g.106322  ORF Transcript_33302/g.106322 Transcript_33302/m.106322 type:complete len:542 (-) Transcript_33302:386-2011(-)
MQSGDSGDGLRKAAEELFVHGLGDGLVVRPEEAQFGIRRSLAVELDADAGQHKAAVIQDFAQRHVGVLQREGVGRRRHRDELRDQGLAAQLELLADEVGKLHEAVVARGHVDFDVLGVRRLGTEARVAREEHDVRGAPEVRQRIVEGLTAVRRLLGDEPAVPVVRERKRDVVLFPRRRLLGEEQNRDVRRIAEGKIEGSHDERLDEQPFVGFRLVDDVRRDRHVVGVDEVGAICDFDLEADFELVPGSPVPHQEVAVRSASLHRQVDIGVQQVLGAALGAVRREGPAQGQGRGLADVDRLDHLRLQSGEAFVAALGRRREDHVLGPESVHRDAREGALPELELEAHHELAGAVDDRTAVEPQVRLRRHRRRSDREYLRPRRETQIGDAAVHHVRRPEDVRLLHVVEIAFVQFTQVPDTMDARREDQDVDAIPELRADLGHGFVDLRPVADVDLDAHRSRSRRTDLLALRRDFAHRTLTEDRAVSPAFREGDRDRLADPAARASADGHLADEALRLRELLGAPRRDVRVAEVLVVVVELVVL